MQNQTRKVKAVPLRRLKMSRRTEFAPAKINYGSYKCRTLMPEDAALVGDLLYTCFHGEIDDEGQSVQGWRSLSRGVFRQGICPISSLILFDEKTPICAMVVVRHGHFRSLDLAMTHPNYRGRGLGAKLIRQCLQNLAGAGFERLSLWVTDGNEAAQALYRKLGFTIEQETYQLKLVIS